MHTVRWLGGGAPIVVVAAIAIACGKTDKTTNDTTTPPPGPVQEWREPAKEEGAARPTQISIGRLHACARMSDDTMRCWGGNDWAQLGAGHADVRTKLATPPIQDVVEVGAGGVFSCARKRDRTVWCWGYNLSGAMGTPAVEENVTAPQQIPGLTDVVALATGMDHACAVRADGSVWCWGENSQSRLGDGTEEKRVGPVRVKGVSGAISIRSEYATCARRSDGSLWCWGHNEGQTAKAMPKLARVTDFDVSGASCALLDDGTVHCWGANDSGQLGRASESEDPAAVPAPVPGLTNVKAVSASTSHACAIAADGTVLCWGDVRPYPWVPEDCRHYTSHSSGGGSALQWHYCPKPTKLPDVTGAAAIDMGWTFSCVLTTDSAIWCWGDGNPPARVTL